VPAAEVSPGRRPPLLRLAALVVLLECAAVAAVAGALVVDIVTGHAAQVAATLAIAAFLLALAAMLLGATRALVRGRRWGRGPVVTWQLIQGAIGATQLGSAPVVGGALLVLAVLALVGILSPASVAATAATQASAEPDD
jgi:hypothetical protein